jgi:sensor histidine kinase YesM
MNRVIKNEKARLYFGISASFLFFWLVSEFGRNYDSFWPRALNNVWRLLYVTAANFILFEYTLLQLSRKRILRSAFLLFVHLMAYSWGLYLWRLIGIGLSIYTPFVTYPSAEKGVTEQMKYSMMSLFYFGVVRHLYNHIRLKQTAQQLRIEKQQAELNYLKSQTNPHFLFNTLNNIYSLSRDKSDLAPEAILRLSKLLRYMLYEAGGEYTAVEQELKIISDYIALEKLRYDESLRINFHHNVEDMRQAMPPLLLIPLVENAFKHGVSETRGQAFVEVHLSIENRNLHFVVRNSSDEAVGEKGLKENIGLSNLRRQLELQYKEYKLITEQKAGVFSAILTINLASHV